MRKVLFVLIATMLLVGCSDRDDTPEENTEETNAVEEVAGESEVNEEDEFDIDELIDNAKQEADESTEEIEKELYLNSINNVLSDYDEQYDVFNIEAGVSFYNLVISQIDSIGIDATIQEADDLLEVLKPEEQEAFGNFLEELIEIEETFSRSDWSD